MSTENSKHNPVDWYGDWSYNEVDSNICFDEPEFLPQYANQQSNVQNKIICPLATVIAPTAALDQQKGGLKQQFAPNGNESGQSFQQNTLNNQRQTTYIKGHFYCIEESSSMELDENYFNYPLIEQQQINFGEHCFVNSSGAQCSTDSNGQCLSFKSVESNNTITQNAGEYREGRHGLSGKPSNNKQKSNKHRKPQATIGEVLIMLRGGLEIKRQHNQKRTSNGKVYTQNTESEMLGENITKKRKLNSLQSIEVSQQEPNSKNNSDLMIRNYLKALDVNSKYYKWEIMCKTAMQLGYDFERNWTKSNADFGKYEKELAKANGKTIINTQPLSKQDFESQLLQMQILECQNHSLMQIVQSFAPQLKFFSKSQSGAYQEILQQPLRSNLSQEMSTIKPCDVSTQPQDQDLIFEISDYLNSDHQLRNYINEDEDYYLF